MFSFFTIARRWASSIFKPSGSGQPWHADWILPLSGPEGADGWKAETISIFQELSSPAGITIRQMFEADSWAHPA